MKKLISLLILTTLQTAQATTPFNGFYFGGAVGATLLDINIEERMYGESPGFFTIDFPSNIDTQGRSAAAWLNLGYSHLFPNQIVLGAEITAGISNPSITQRNQLNLGGSTFSSKIESELKNDFAILFRAGYLIKHHTQGYAFVGPRWGNFESSLDDIYDSTEFSASDSTSGYQLGVTAGVGLEHLLTKQLSLGLEYAYTYYGEIASLETRQVTTGFSPTPAPFTDTATLKASTNTLGAKLNYHF